MAHVKNIDDFSDFEATLQQIEEILKTGGGDDNATDKELPKAKTLEDFDNLNVDTVRLAVREDRSLINKKTDEEVEKQRPGFAPTMDQQGFMQEVERDANERAQSRAKREYEAEMQRNQGNDHFRNGHFEKAILHYSKAVERVKDSAITYNNRALCYIKLRNYKRALTDCQYVLDKLQETNLRSWLYKATAYKHLKDTEKFEESVAKVREHNPHQLAYIDKFISQIDVNM